MTNYLTVEEAARAPLLSGIEDAVARAALLDARANLIEFPLPGRYRLTTLGADGWGCRLWIGHRRHDMHTGETDKVAAELMAATLYHRWLGSERLMGPGVYVIGVPGFIKIGRAVKIARRLEAIQTTTPYDATLLTVTSTDPNDEGSFHSAMRAHRARGEWFVRSRTSLEELGRAMQRLAT